MIEIDKLMVEWPCEAIVKNFSNNHSMWKVTTSRFYDEMLGALPPAHRNKYGFLLGEKYGMREREDGKYEHTYYGFVCINDAYYSKLCFLSTFDDECEAFASWLKDKTPA